MARRSWCTRPLADAGFKQYVAHPELAALLPNLYPGVFPNLAGYNKERFDLEAILLTGLPKGVVAGFAGNFTGPAPADLLRLNMAIAPNPGAVAGNVGLLGGDTAGFPNGRRVFDDIVAIELRAVAGMTIPLVDPTYTPDAAANLLTQGVNPDPSGDRYLKMFPYLATPRMGTTHPRREMSHSHHDASYWSRRHTELLSLIAGTRSS